MGKSIVQVLSKELQKEFPGAKGYSAANLWRMRNFYLTYRDSEKLAPLVRVPTHSIARMALNIKFFIICSMID